MTTGLLKELTGGKSERDRFLDEAVAARKFSAARRAHYAALYDRDPHGTRTFVERLAPAPPGEQQGTGLV